MSEMLVHVRLFAMLRERAGTDRVELRLRRDATVAEALLALGELAPLGELLERMPVRMAVNRDYADAGTTLAEEDELALIPPLSGGAPTADGRAPARPQVRVSAEELSLDAIARAVADPAAGAIVIFQGVTREVERLDYEAYTAMAEERIETIVRDCIARHELCAAAVEHRVGSVPLGQPSVIVAVSAPHRAEAFAAASEAIDRVKAEAPIWKREHAAGAAPRWVPGTEPPA